jgi:hypothetical protein
MNERCHFRFCNAESTDFLRCDAPGDPSQVFADALQTILYKAFCKEHYHRGRGRLKRMRLFSIHKIRYEEFVIGKVMNS